MLRVTGIHVTRIVPSWGPESTRTSMGGSGRPGQFPQWSTLPNVRNFLNMTICTFCECPELCVCSKLLQKPYQAFFVNIRWCLSWRGQSVFSYFRYFETIMSFAAELGHIYIAILWIGCPNIHQALYSARQFKVSLAGKADKANVLSISDRNCTYSAKQKRQIFSQTEMANIQPNSNCKYPAK